MRQRWLLLTGSVFALVYLGSDYHGAPRPKPAQIVRAAKPASPVRAFIDQYCVTCHNDKTKAAGLVLNTSNVDDVAGNTDLWEKVVRKLQVRAMPPVGKPRPEEAVYEQFLTELESSLDAAATAKPKPGRTATFHRLNRTEYRNAIRDLLDLDVDDVESLLPRDEESYGFDNVNVAALPPALMERYVSAAQKISRRAVGGSGQTAGPTLVELPADLTQEEELEGMPLGTRGGTLFRHAFPQDGAYEIEIRLARDRDENIEGLTESHQIELSLDGQRVQLWTVTPGPSNGENSYYQRTDLGVFTFRLPVKAGPHEVGVVFLNRPAVLSEQDREPFLASFNIYRHPRNQPALYRVSVAGPFQPGGPGDSPSRRRIFTCHPTGSTEETECGTSILSSLARRAYRRPINRDDVQVLAAFYKEGRYQGGFDDGIQRGLAAVLVSPEFLFRIEREPSTINPKTPYRITDLELASRLSFFLWSSIPDDELLSAAVDGSLRSSAVLEKEVRRMLADDRSQALVVSFASQWLQLRNLAGLNRSPRLFPDFDDNLRQAFRRETELFFKSVVNEDRNVLDLLRANYTFLNERLARHYSIPNVYGSRFRRVSLDEDSPRVGLLGQGSFLAVTSYETRTAPTLRGKWILENILGTPPPPAPPNIPALKEAASDGKIFTMRERMVQHRDNASCATCHQMMDPLGLALENFDAVGRWRNHDEGGAIDATGTLLDGTKFEGLSGLRQALLNRPEPFLMTLTEKLLTYGLGRGLESYDAPAVRKIVNGARSNDYRFSSIVLGIVNSTPFQMRMSQ